MRETAAYLATRQDSALLPLAGVHDRLTRKQSLPAVKTFLEFAARVADKQEGRSALRVLDLFDAVVAYRNQELGHGAMRERAFYAEAAPLLLEAALEAVNALRPVGDLQFVVARDVVDPRTQKASRRFDILRGDGLHLPLETSHPKDAEVPAGRLLLAAGSARVPLHPLLVYEIDKLDRDRVGFLNHVAAQGRGDTQKLKRVEYLDYDSGDRLDGHDALTELAVLLSKVRGQSVSAEAVALLSQSGTEAMAQAAPSDKGQFIGDFELLEELGRGGMGIVYKARQNSLRRIVALKVLPPALASDPVSVARFRREIAALGRCDHPNVIKVLTAGHDGERHFYAMEYVEGSDLAQVCGVLTDWRTGTLKEGHILRAITDSRAQRGPGSKTGQPPLPEVPKAASSMPEISEGRDYFTRLAEIMADAAAGVQHLHEHGIIHRDLKPANIMLTQDGKRAVVMDLGLAQLQDRSLSLTASSVKILGTLRYMPPEQLQHQMLEVTPRADIYSLGASLYELAALSPMFDGDTEARLMQQVLQEEPKSPRSRNGAVPRDLETIITVAAAKAPNDRYATAGALAADLRAFAQGLPISARAPSTFHYLKLFYRKNKALAHSMAAALVIMLGLTAWFIASLDESRARAETAAELAREKEAEAHIEAERANKAEQDAQEKAQAAQKARDEADTQRSVAEEKTREVEAALKDAARNLQQIHMEKGKAASERGEVGMALQHFAEATRMAEELGDSARFGQARDQFSALEPRQPFLLWRSEPSALLRVGPWISLSADGRLMAGHEGARATVVETATGKEVRVFTDKSDYSNTLLSHDGRRLMLATWEKISLVDVESGATLGADLPFSSLGAACFTPEGKSLWLIGGKHELLELDAGTGAQISRRSIGREVAGAAFSPEGTHFVAWVKGKRLEVFEAASLKSLCSIETGANFSHALGLTAGAKEVLLGTDGKRLKVWSTTDGANLADLEVAVPYGKTICTTTDGKAIVLKQGGGALSFEGNWQAPREIPAQGRLNRSLCLLPGGRGLVVGRAMAAPLFLSLPGGESLARLPGFNARPGTAEWSPDRRFVAVTTLDFTIVIVEAMTGAIVRTLGKVETAPRCVKWLPDGLHLACVGMGEECMLVLDAHSGEVLARSVKFDANERAVDLAVSPDGSRVFACTSKPRVISMSAGGQSAALEFKLPSGGEMQFAPAAMRISSDGAMLTVADNSGLVLQLAADDGALLRRFDFGEGQSSLVAIDSDGSRVAVASSRDLVRVCDLATKGQFTFVIKNPDEATSCTFGAGNELIVTDLQRRVRAVDFTSGVWRELLSLPDRPAVFVSTDRGGRALLTISDGGLLSLYTLESARTLRVLLPGIKEVFDLFSLRGTTLVAVGAQDSAGVLMDLSDGTIVATLGDARAVTTGFALSHDGRSLICGGMGGSVMCYDLSTGRARALCTIPEEMACLGLAYSPDDATVALSFFSDKGVEESALVRIVNAATGKMLRDLKIPGAPLVFVRFLKNGNQFIAGRMNGTAALCESSSGAIVREFGAETNQTLAFDFDSEQGLLLMPGAEGTLSLVSVGDGKVVGEFKGDFRFAIRSVFSPDGKRVASCGNDRIVRVWNVAGGQEIARGPMARGGEMTGLTFSQDGQYLIHMDSERRLVSWDYQSRSAVAGIRNLDAATLKALAQLRAETRLHGFEVAAVPPADSSLQWQTRGGIAPVPQSGLRLALPQPALPDAARDWILTTRSWLASVVVESATLSWRRERAAWRHTFSSGEHKPVSPTAPWNDEQRVNERAWALQRRYGADADACALLMRDEEAGNWAAAASRAYQLLQVHKDDLWLTFRAARAALRSQSWEDAEALFVSVLERDPENLAALAGASIADARSREVSAKLSLARLDKVLAAGIKDAAIFVTRARLLLTIDGSHEPVKAACAEALKLDPANLEAFEVMAQCERAAGNTQAEEAWRTKAIEAHPDRFELWEVRGDLRSEQGQHESAIADYSQAIELLLKLPKERRSQKLCLLLIKRAGIHEVLEERDAALKDLSAAIAERPNDNEMFSARGWFYLRQGEWRLAFVDFGAAVKTGFGKGDDYYALAIAAEKLGDLGMALLCYREAMSYQTPNFEEYCFGAACVASALAQAFEAGALSFSCRPEAERKKLEADFAGLSEEQRKASAREMLDNAFDLLDSLVDDYLADEDGLAKLKEDPRLERARKDPRWAELIKSVKDKSE
ncbi:Serine/threonine-protein kinase PknB [Planctomycetaceae bacterium]|nr:Serine/threonine-protein kinase PknB [Planctomycetaceae bacterium]